MFLLHGSMERRKRGTRLRSLTASEYNAAKITCYFWMCDRSCVCDCDALLRHIVSACDANWYEPLTGRKVRDEEQRRWQGGTGRVKYKNKGAIEGKGIKGEKGNGMR